MHDNIIFEIKIHLFSENFGFFIEYSLPCAIVYFHTTIKNLIIFIIEIESQYKLFKFKYLKPKNKLLHVHFFFFSI